MFGIVRGFCYIKLDLTYNRRIDYDNKDYDKYLEVMWVKVEGGKNGHLCYLTKIMYMWLQSV